jgi:hypothetical protein
VIADRRTQFRDIAVKAAVQIDNRILDGDELQPVSFGNGDADGYAGVFDNLLAHGNPRPRSGAGLS